MPARAVPAALVCVRPSRGVTASTRDPTTSRTPARARALDGVRGSLRDSATASVAGSREVREDALRAATCTTPTSSATVATAGSGP
jgi:hypothetical protein